MKTAGNTVSEIVPTGTTSIAQICANVPYRYGGRAVLGVGWGVRGQRRCGERAKRNRRGVGDSAEKTWVRSDEEAVGWGVLRVASGRNVRSAVRNH